MYPSKIDCARDFRQLWTLAANICEMDQDINNRKQTWSTAISPALDKKFGELGFSNKKVIKAEVNRPWVDNAHSVYANILEFGSRDFAASLQGKFQPTNFFPSRTYGAGRPHVGLCPIFLVMFCIGHVEIFLLVQFNSLNFASFDCRQFASSSLFGFALVCKNNNNNNSIEIDLIVFEN